MATTIDTAALTGWIAECARQIELNLEVLNDLDSTSGDADHGSNLHRGFSAVAGTALKPTAETPQELLKNVGTTLVSTVGGSSGALYGTFFLRMARACGSMPALDREALGSALAAAGQGIQERGQTEVGDKTLFDALAPAIDAYREAASRGEDLASALAAASSAADGGRDATSGMLARKGRASYLGERTLGSADAGATSMALIISAAAKTLS